MNQSYVRDLFDSIAHRYDFLNHLLSGGIDSAWRRRAIDHLAGTRPKRVLDVATGTADFAIAALRLSPEQVVGVDIAGAMLEIGRRKLKARGQDRVVVLETGRAEQLRFETGTFDAAIVAFGARNFENLRTGLAEMYRVLRPGGTIVVLEFSRPAAFPLRQLYFFYFRRILPLVGRLVSGSRHAYTYLPETVLKFPEGTEFLRILQDTGFRETAQERLTFGIASVYTGVRG
jgi:demethylmenaquinone methyltransferase/2-methoxy-6-polyprenyl-1,4-benzoquinol methylase